MKFYYSWDILYQKLEGYRKINLEPNCVPIGLGAKNPMDN